MATVALTLLPAGLTLQVKSGATILASAHAAGVDIEATCGGRGRCTSCRVKFVSGIVPPPSIMDELQLGDALVREGYRLSCQCRVSDPITVQVSPPVDDRSFQILGGERPAGAPMPVTRFAQHAHNFLLGRNEFHKPAFQLAPCPAIT